MHPSEVFVNLYKINNKESWLIILNFSTKLCQRHERAQTFKVVKAYLVMLSIFALRPYFLRVCIDVLQSQNFLGTWDSWELQQEHFPDLNSVQIDTRQADRKRERKEEEKKVVCLKSHVTGKAVLRNRSSNCLCKASSILQPIKWIFKLIQLNRKQNKRVYNISAVIYAGQET